MRHLSLLTGLSALAACASPLPSPDPRQAWVEPYAVPGQLLMADRLDGRRLHDGRYFQVSPGAHELQARFQFEVQSSGGLDGPSEPRSITCMIRVRYADFAAGRRFRLEARPLAHRAQAWLYDERRQVLARGQVLRCGAY